jgi:hypothetical protein
MTWTELNKSSEPFTDKELDDLSFSIMKHLLDDKNLAISNSAHLIARLIFTIESLKKKSECKRCIEVAILVTAPIEAFVEYFKNDETIERKAQIILAEQILKRLK